MAYAAKQPTLTGYHWIVVNSSAGKDSQAMLDYVVQLARAAGVLERVVVVHCDLGRMEWAGTRELAERQAAHYGLRFEVVSRIGGTAKVDGKAYRAGETFGDLLDYVERRQKWPDNQNRFCTSDFKRGPVSTLLTRLAAESRKSGVRYPRLLNCLGLRAQESPGRAKEDPFQSDEKNTNGRRLVDRWLPIHDWTTERVWERIRASGVEHHRAYDVGMKRLSCAFCIFAPKAALLIAAKHNPELLREYARVEQKIGHTFTKKLPIVEVLAAYEAGEAEHAEDRSAADDGCWNM